MLSSSLIVLNAFLWRLGGAGAKPFRRYWRRLGYPTLAVIFGFLGNCNALQLSLLFLTTFLTTTLPVTLGDDDIDSWSEWIWIFVLGYLLGLPCVLLHGWSGLLLSFIPAVAQGVALFLSNHSKTATIFTHEFVEAVAGASVMIAITGG